MTERLRVTLDTNMLDEDTIEHVRAVLGAAGIDHELLPISVSDRELGRPTGLSTSIFEGAVSAESSWGSMWSTSPSIPETLLLDESRTGSSRLAGDNCPNRLEGIIEVITNGSFPKVGQRSKLSPLQRRQLRDAMILEAHAREERDVFITNDVRGFVKHGRREKLEAICNTKIVTKAEVGNGWPAGAPTLTPPPP